MDTISLRCWDNEHVWHPFTPMQAYRDECAPIIVGGSGFFLHDSDGRRYLDGISSLWCNVHGHRVPEIDAAVRAQLDRVAHSTLLGLSNQPTIELARELTARTPAGLNKVFFSDSGATAVEVALKIAYQFYLQRSPSPGRRDLFACLSEAYHGDTIGSVSVGGMDTFHDRYRGLLFDTVKVPAPVAFRTPRGYDADAWLAHCYAALEKTLAEHRNRLAGFIIEPLVQGAAGILVHPTGYLKRVRDLTAEHGVLLIADEVAVGFGRTGTMFACEQEDVQPDLLCLAKGLSGGYLPLAATLATDEIYNAFLGDAVEGKTFFHGHTFTGNPLGCAASLASLRLFDERNVLENVRMNSDRIRERLATLAEFIVDGSLRDPNVRSRSDRSTFHPHVGEVRQKGIMVGIELVRDRETKTPFPPQMRMGHRVALAARRRGVIIRPLGDVVVLMPAPSMPADLVEQLCDAAIESIDEATAQSA